jgi:uncharacterized protein YbaR (Trm112 family)
MIDKKLLDILACPVCKGRLELHAERAQLTCARCRVGYPIEDGIPNLLPDAGRPIHEAEK